MQAAENEGHSPTPQESWDAIRETMESARSSLYVAGTATILLIWGAIASLGYLAEFGIATWGEDLRESYPWVSGPLWLGLVAIGMAASAFAGNRAGQKLVPGEGSRQAGLRVFFFWAAVVVATFVIPGAGGVLAGEDAAVNVPRVTIGIAGLGFVLFGIMVRPMLAAIGVGIVAAFYVPSFALGDSALAVAAALTLLVVALSALWVRKSGLA